MAMSFRPSFSPRVLALSGLLSAGLIAFICVRTAVLNVFYAVGDLTDPGWQATIIWHNNWHLEGPPALSGSFFSEHISPIFWLVNLISYILPLSKLDFYAAFMAGIYALFATGVYRAWQLGDERITAGKCLVAVAIALAATFSAVGMNTLRLPHYELLIPALGLWFFISMAERRYGWASFWFVLCLMVREDAGLHLFGLLVLWGVVVRFYRQPGADIRAIFWFAVIALSYAALAFVVKHAAFPADNFSRAYAGNPRWQHLTAEFLSERFWFYLTERTYITLPLLVTLVWAVFSRNPLLPVGYLACLPWMALHFIAVSYTTGTLSYYYSFPFWLALAWPLVALRLWPPAQAQRPAHWPYLLVLLPSLVGWRFDHVIVYPLDKNFFTQHPFAVTAELRNRQTYDTFVSYFIDNQSRFGNPVLDKAASGLLINYVDRDNWLSDEHPDPPDSIIYFEDAYERDRVAALLRTGIYTRFYEVPGTKIRVAAKQEIELGWPLVAVPPPRY
jgi:hypothetical protein